jgi:CheY-like chemotaxis protein
MSSIATILIVDDDPLAIQALHSTLRGLGSIRYATSGADALALAAGCPVDLVLLDAHMPEMDGFETCRALLRDHPDLTILFVTADIDFATEAHALEAGAHDLINKPVNPPVVRARVNLHLSLKAHMDREREARSAADAATRAKSSFLARMSHELRTPITVIGMADMLLQTSLTPGQREYAETIRGCGQSLVSLIGDILGVSKIEAGKLEIEAIDFDLAEMVDGVGAVTKPVSPRELRQARARGLGTATTAPGAPPAAPTPVFAGVRALLADDNSINQKVGRASLRKLGLEVDLVADGVQAVEAAAASRYDVILMDLSMPRMDGLEATRRIRAMATGSTSGDVPIIAMTASASTTDREACRAAGMNGFLSKPVSVVALGQTLAGCLKPEAR